MKFVFPVFLILFSLVGCQKAKEDTAAQPSPPVSLSIQYDLNESLISGTCSKEHKVLAVNISGNQTNVTIDQIIKLTSPSLTVSFYKDELCSQQITSLKMPVGTSSISFFVKNTIPEYFNFTAATTNIQSDTQAQTSISPNAARLAVVGPSSLAAGECSSSFTIKSQNVNGQDAAVTSDTSISFSNQGVGKLYSSSDCSGAAINSATIPTGENFVRVYFKSTKTGVFSINAAAPGPVTTKINLSVRAGTASQLVFLSNPQTITAGNCSNSYSIQLQDSFGNPASFNNSTSISLSGSQVQFFTNAGCSPESLTSFVVIPANSTSGSFFVSSTSTSANAINISGIGSQTQSLTVNSARATRLFFPPIINTISAGNAFNTIRVESRDDYGNTVTGITRQYQIGAYSDQFCNVPTSSNLNGLSQITTNGVAAFSSLNYPKAETIYIGVKSAGLSSYCSAPIIVRPDFPSKLLISGPNSVKAGECSSSFSVQSTDQFNNISSVPSTVSLTLSGGGSGFFYIFPDCSGNPISSLSILANSSIAKFYYKNINLENNIFSASGLGGSPSTIPVSTGPGIPVKIALFNPVSITAGQCASGFSVKSQDVFGNDSIVSEATSVLLSQSGQGQFFSDIGCTIPVSSVNISANSSQKQFFFKNTKVENVSINAQALSSVTKIITVNPALANKLKIRSPFFALAGSPISSLSVEVQDVYGNKQHFAGNSIGVTAYADSECKVETNPAISGTRSRAAVSGTATFNDISYNLIGDIYLGAASGLLSKDCFGPLAIRAAAPTILSLLSVDGSTSAGQCSQIKIQTKDSVGNVSPVVSETSFSLSSTGSALFYSDSTCQNNISNSSLATGEYEKIFYIKDLVAETVEISASSLGFSGSSLSRSFVPASPQKLKLIAPTSITAGICTSGIEVQTLDAYNNLSPVNQNSIFQFSTSGPGSFYSDDQCSTAISSIQFLSGQNKKNVFFRAQTAQTISLSINGTGFLPDSLSGIVISPQNPTNLVLSGPTNLNAGQCSSAYSLSIQDIFGNDSPTLENLSINFNGIGSGGIYTNSTCTGSNASKLIIPANQKSVNFYFKNTKAEILNLSFSALNSSVNKQITTAALAANKIYFKSAPKNIIAGSCSGGIEIALKDQYDNETTSSAPVQISFSNEKIKIYNNASCSGASVSQQQINANLNSVAFYASSTDIISGNLIATSILSESEQLFNVNPGQASRLQFVQNPSSGFPGTNSFSIPFIVQVSDQFNNKVSSTQALISLEPYTDQLCQNISQTILTGTTLAPVTNGLASFSGLGYALAEPLYVKASSLGLESACSPVINISASGPYKIALSGLNSGSAGSCLGPFAVTAKDFFNNTTSAISDLPISFLGIGSSKLYSSSDCSGSSFTQSKINSGQESLIFYLKDTVAENILVEATSSLGSSTLPLSISPLAPSKQKIMAESNIPQNVCSGPYFVESTDSFDNEIPVTLSESLSFFPSGNTQVYSDSACSNVVSSITLDVANSRASFYLRNPIKEDFSLIVDGPILGSSFKNFTVIDPPAISLAITSSESDITAGACSGPFNVEQKNQFGDPVIAVSNVIVNLTGSGNGSFYSDSNCSSSIGSITISPGLSSKNFFYKNTKAEAVSLTATNPSLSNGIFPLGINAGQLNSLSFYQQPPLNIESNQIIFPSPQVVYSDQYGNKVFNPSDQITLSLEFENGETGPTIFGTNSLLTDPLTGIATFEDIKIKKSGRFRIKAVGASFSVLSQVFTVSSGPVKNIEIISGNNQLIARNKKSLAPFVVKTTDIDGNPASASVNFILFSGSGSLSPNGTLTSAITVSSNSTGLAEVYYYSSSNIESPLIEASFQNSSPTKVVFSAQTINYSPISATISQSESLEFSKLESPINIAGSGIGLSSILEILPNDKNAISVSGSGFGSSGSIFSQDPMTSLLLNSTNGSDILNLDLSAQFPTGILTGSCSLSPSSISYQNLSCSLGTNGVSITRSSLVPGTIKAKISSDQSIAGTLDFINSNEIKTRKISIKKFSNISVTGSDSPKNFVVHNNLLYFSAQKELGITKLYRTDGSSQITQISDINGSVSDKIGEIKTVGANLFFVAENNLGKSKLFRYDGFSIKQISDIVGGQNLSDEIRSLAVLGSKLYLSAAESYDTLLNVYNNKLFEINDTQIKQISNIAPGKNDSVNFINNLNSDIYFSSETLSGARNLYRYSPITNIISQISSISNNPLVKEVFVFSGKVYFEDNNSSGGAKLFSYSPTTNQIYQVLNTRQNESLSDDVKFLGSCGNNIFVASIVPGDENIPGNSHKLFKIDTISNKTTQISDNVIGESDFSSLSGFGVNELTKGVCYGTDFYVPLNNPNKEQKLHKFDGQNLYQVSDIVSGGHDNINELIIFNNYIYFDAGSLNNNKIYRLCNPELGCSP